MLIVQGATRRPPRGASGPTNGQVRTDRPTHSLTSPFWDLPVFNINLRVANELRAASGKSVADLQGAIDGSGKPQSMALPGVTVQMRRAVSERRNVQTHNVVGVIEGSDPKLKDEYVIVTGHFDHVGQKAPYIFYGADDNASACAAVIALAEAIKASPTPPKRSVMFLVFEAEEDFLQGAFHYVDHPIVPLAKSVAVLNMDMIGRDEDSATWNIKAVEERQIVELPLSGRNFTSLGLLTPGVTTRGQSTSDASYVVHGQRQDSNNFQLDGVANVSLGGNTVQARPNVDAVQEFKIQTSNFSAEFGRNSGSVVQVVTKSGTNSLRGSGWEFHRNDRFQARNFFATAEPPPLKQNQYGGTLGGPVSIPGLYSGRNRTFFFGSFEGYRLTRGMTRQAVVATEQERGGDFSFLSRSIVDPDTGRPFPAM